MSSPLVAMWMVWSALVPAAVCRTALAQPAAPATEVRGAGEYNENDRARGDALRLCGLGPDFPATKAPWYFHYEMGLRLARRGEPAKALEAVYMAMERRSESQRRVRIYGMWFIDYVPCFQAARLHAELGDWKCAMEAIRSSEARNEIPAGSKDHAAFAALRQRVSAALSR